MTEHKEQPKQAVKNGTTKANNSRNESLIQHLSEEQKRLALRELLTHFLPEVHSGTILTPNYWLSYFEVLSEHQTSFFKSEFESLTARKDKRILSEENYHSGIYRVFKIQESIEFSTQIISAIVHSTCPIV